MDTYLALLSVVEKSMPSHKFSIVMVVCAFEDSSRFACSAAAEKKQSDQIMSETTNHVVLEGGKSANFEKCRKSFLCRFCTFLVVFKSF